VESLIHEEERSSVLTNSLNRVKRDNVINWSRGRGFVTRVGEAGRWKEMHVQASKGEGEKRRRKSSWDCPQG